MSCLPKNMEGNSLDPFLGTETDLICFSDVFDSLTYVVTLGILAALIQSKLYFECVRASGKTARWGSTDKTPAILAASHLTKTCPSTAGHANPKIIYVEHKLSNQGKTTNTFIFLFHKLTPHQSHHKAADQAQSTQIS